LKLDDGKPWFRRWLVIGFWPITSEGKLLLELMAAICLLTGFLALFLADDYPQWTIALVAVTTAAVIAGYVFIYWKREDPF
jgi:hypothetical protein